MHDFRWLIWLGMASCVDTAYAQPAGVPWRRHTIDAGSRGADGVRLADINGDGLMDVATGWEEGGEVRVYINPGPEQAKELWPRVVMGKATAVEDAVFADVNRDGRLDVVACCEGQERSVWAYLAGEADLLLSASWQPAAFPAVKNQQQWMFALPLPASGDVASGDASVDLILGSKGKEASISRLSSPRQQTAGKPFASELSRWTVQRLTNAGWIMSLRLHDMDGDGDPDIIFSDRRGDQAGCWWLENPGSAGTSQNASQWKRHPIAGIGKQVMFLDFADVDGDQREDVVAAVSGGDIVMALRSGDAAQIKWRESTVLMPPEVGTGKAVAVADVNQDGGQDLIVTCENANGVRGVFWLQAASSAPWQPHDISGVKEGIKFDRIELLDLDADGDLDVMTCEERDNLGVIWYENPTR